MNTFEDLIKESRKTREDERNDKLQYHRKNPKSIAYYEKMKQNIDIKNKTEQTFEIITNITEKGKLMSSNTYEIIEDIAEVKTSIKSANTHDRKQKTEKSTQNIKLMAHNLEKFFNKLGIRFIFSSNYQSVQIFKQFQLSVVEENKKVNLNPVLKIAQIQEFPKIVKTYNNVFVDVKNHFAEITKEKVSNINPEHAYKQLLNKLLYQNPKIPAYAKEYIHEIEKNISHVARKSSKQGHGLESKVQGLIDIWLERVSEVHNIEMIEDKLNLKSYEQSFNLARSIKRKFSIFVGPTNSGKTYHALNEMKNAQNGLYLAPLRLMAAEGQESLSERGIVANLITGEEQNYVDGAHFTSSTIEMCRFSEIVDIAVIDEIQMIADKSRGWAWSQALVGVPAKHVVLVGSAEALPYIMPIIEELGEEFEIKTFERKNSLETIAPLNKLNDLHKGDCMVVFSRKSGLEMKYLIESTGKKCSIIYGNLSPEVRKQEAQKFKSGENEILIATDAIGMGLNLPIKRIIFSTLSKYDGYENRYLNVSEIKQIAGRAGRYGFSDKGQVALFQEYSSEAQTILDNAIYQGYESPYDTKVYIAPNLEQVKVICEVIGKNDLYSALVFFNSKLVKDSELYKASDLESMLNIASQIKGLNLDLHMGFTYSCVPTDLSLEFNAQHFFKWIKNHKKDLQNEAPELPSGVKNNSMNLQDLYEAEIFVKLCMAYKWLHYKYPDIYNDIDTVNYNVKKSNTYIEKTLNQSINLQHTGKHSNRYYRK